MCRVEVWKNICSALRQINGVRARYSFSVGKLNIVMDILG